MVQILALPFGQMFGMDLALLVRQRLPGLNFCQHLSCAHAFLGEIQRLHNSASACTILTMPRAKTCSLNSSSSLAPQICETHSSFHIFLGPFASMHCLTLARSRAASCALRSSFSASSRSFSRCLSSRFRRTSSCDARLNSQMNIGKFLSATARMRMRQTFGRP